VLLADSGATAHGNYPGAELPLTVWAGNAPLPKPMSVMAVTPE
jgi:hypothetical protein